MSFDRPSERWSQHLDQIVRSKHYTWLAEGLGGEPLDTAFELILADMRHICEREGISWEALVDRSQRRFERERNADQMDAVESH